MNKKILSLLSFAHFVTDLNQGALPALLPFFKEALNLSYTLSGAIVFSSNLTSSIIQPVFGHLSDKRRIEWFLPLAPLIACLGMSLTGFTQNYSILIIFVILSGIGIAIFHPEGFKTAHFFTGEKKATGMSFFAVGGNLGIALGPLWAILLVTSFGSKGTLTMILPGLIIFMILFFHLKKISSLVKSPSKETSRQTTKLSKEQKLSFFILILVATIRAWTHFGLATYIPFYYINYLKGNPLYAGKLVSTFLLSGAAGTLLGGPIADRIGHKRFLLITLILSFFLLLLFYNSKNWLIFFFLGLAGLVLISTFAITTVMAQMLLPQHLGMASGMMVGFTMSAGGMGVTLLGAISDLWGVPIAMKVILFLPLIGFGLGWAVKYPLKIEGVR
ncbi:MAG: MFS transporter [Thermodesulfobacteriota bacterium]